MKITNKVLIVASMALMAVMLYQWGHVDGREGKSSGIISESIAAESPPKASPVEARARDFYAPNSEDLRPDEMRLIACGTGMPTARPKQAASCWLLELGNGDKFIFDVGTGSAERIAAMQIPYNYLDKVFLSHLHTDHWADLNALWAGGGVAVAGHAAKGAPASGQRRGRADRFPAVVAAGVAGTSLGDIGERSGSLICCHSHLRLVGDERQYREGR